MYTRRGITTPKIDAVNRRTKITKQNVFYINRAFEKPSTKHISYAIYKSYSSFNIKFIRKNTTNCSTKVFNTIYTFNMLVILSKIMISGFEEFTRKMHSYGFPAIEDNIVLCSKFDATINKPLKLGAKQQMSSAYIRLFKHLSPIQQPISSRFNLTEMID